MVPRMLEKYKKEISPALLKEFGYKNVMQLPRVEKVVVNIGVGDAKLDIKFMDAAIAELREGMPVACSVTLRGTRMWEFLDRLISLALPSIKDFQGVSRRGFDGRGNYNLGLREQLIFPEISYDKVIRSRGMNVSIVTSASTDEEAHALLKGMGMPFNNR